MTSIPQETEPPGQAALPSGFGRHFSKPLALVFLELFVAVSLTVNFFYLIRTQCLPSKAGDPYSAFTFSRFSKNVNIDPEAIQPAWRKRLAGPILSSWFHDWRLKEKVDITSGKYHNLFDLIQSAEYQNIFGCYHAVWVFLLFLALIFFRSDALLLMLGTFAGLMYHLTDPLGMACFPWDLPSLFLFTLACLLFDKGRIWMLLPVIVVGALFKETMLCCALFVLLGGHWNWKKRIAAFLAVIVVSFAINRLLMAQYGIQSRMLGMNNAKSFSDLFLNTWLFQNVHSLFSLNLRHVIFANAGSLLLMILLPWRNRRDVLFKVVIWIFIGGQFLYGIINEVRIWYELLPLGWMLISERISSQPAPSTSRSPLLAISHWALMGGLVVVALVVLALAKFYAPPPDKVSGLIPSLTIAAQNGDARAQAELGAIYQSKNDFDAAINWFSRAAESGNADAQCNLGILLYRSRHDYAGAADWFRKAAAQGHADALYDLGGLYWQGEGVKPDAEEALRFFEEAGKRGHPQAQMMLGVLYQQPGPKRDLFQAYKWCKLALLAGHNEIQKQLEDCAAAMTTEQVEHAEQLVQEFSSANKSTPASK